MPKSMQVFSTWFSEGSIMSISSALSATWEFCSRVSSEAICSSGAMVRPTRILQPISAPMVIRPSEIRYTPHTTIATVTSWVTSMAEVTARLLYLRASLLDFAESPTIDSHSFCMRFSAMQDLSVSSPATISTNRAFFCMFCL